MIKLHPTVKRAVLLVLAAFLCLNLPVVLAQSSSDWKITTDSLIHSVAVAPDGRHVALGTRNGIVHYLDASGKELWNYDTKGTVLGLSLTEDGQKVLAGTENRKAILLDGNGNLIWEKSFKFVIQSAAISPSGELIVLAPKTKAVYGLDGEGNLIWEVPSDTPPTAVTVSPDGTRVVAGFRDAMLRTYDYGGILLWQTQLTRLVRGVSATNEAAIVAATDESGKAYYIKVENNVPSTVWTHDIGDKGYSASVTLDGTTAAFGSGDKSVYLLDDTGKVLLQQQTDGIVMGVSLSADGGLLAYGTDKSSAGGIGTSLGSSGFAAAQQRTLILSIVIPLLILAAVAAVILFLRLNPAGRHWWEVNGAGIRRILRNIWRSKVSYILLAPTFILLAIFNYFPAFSGLYHSFTKWSPGLYARWIGLDNFVAIFNNTFFWSGMVNAIILVVTGFIKLAMPLLVAEMLFHLRSQTTQYWLRSLFIFPIVVPGVASILIWRNILDPNIGLLNNFLALLGLMNMAQPQAWLGDTRTAIWSIVFIGFPWIGPFALLIFYGGLISISTEVFDAAKVDGASRLNRFWYIDLPLLMGQIKLLLILGFIGGMQEFTIIFLTTEGGPYNATYTPALELYYQAMRFNNFGLASAMGTFLFLLVLGGTILNLRMRTTADSQP